MSTSTPRIVGRRPAGNHLRDRARLVLWTSAPVPSTAGPAGTLEAFMSYVDRGARLAAAALLCGSAVLVGGPAAADTSGPVPTSKAQVEHAERTAARPAAPAPAPPAVPQQPAAPAPGGGTALWQLALSAALGAAVTGLVVGGRRLLGQPHGHPVGP